MKIPKPTDADRGRFTALVPDAPGVEVKAMFGNLGALLNGNTFMGLFGASIGVKLPDDQRAELLALPGAGPFCPEERPMGGYVALPSAWTATKAAPWVDRALAAAAAQPPRAPRKRAAKKRAPP